MKSILTSPATFGLILIIISMASCIKLTRTMKRSNVNNLETNKHSVAILSITAYMPAMFAIFLFASKIIPDNFWIGLVFAQFMHISTSFVMIYMLYIQGKKVFEPENPKFQLTNYLITN
jgi:hypothetical protein